MNSFLIFKLSKIIDLSNFEFQSTEFFESSFALVAGEFLEFLPNLQEQFSDSN